MMKRIIIISGIVFILIIAGIASIPLFFKQQLIDATKATISKQINADVEFSAFSLSLFRSFPKASIQLKEVSISGKNEFENDTLFAVPDLRARMSLFSLFSKSGMSIEEIVMEQPRLYLLIGESGNENWALEGDEPQTSKPENNKTGEDQSFELQLEKIELNNGVLIYEDRTINMLLSLNQIDVNVNGKMYGTSTELLAEGTVGSLTLNYDNVSYISNISLETKSLFDIDYEKMDIAIKESELLVNRLPLQLTGLIQVPSDSVFFDLGLQTRESGFENFLALVPPSYEEYLKDIKTNGSATIAGTVKGLYYNENYPSFSLKLDVQNGNFKYIGLPEEIKNISANVVLSKPQGVLDLTEVKVNRAHAEIKNNPVDLSLIMSRLVSDPYFNGKFVGKINFDHLKDVLPLDSVNVSGIVDANIFVKGNYSSIEKEQYDKIQSDGTISLQNFLYETPELTQKINVAGGKLDFSPKFVTLRDFNMQVGQSDFSLQGNVSDYLNYFFKDGILKGDLQLNSNTVNVNELLRLQVIKETPGNTKKSQQNELGDENQNEEILAFDIPENIDITFRSNIKYALFDRLPISNIDGLITAKNGKLILNGLNMNTLDGELKLTGSYQNTAQNQPLFDFGFDIIRFNIPTAYHTINGVSKIAPVAGKSRGRLSTTFKMNGILNSELKLIPASIDGNGFFNTHNLEIIDSEIFRQIKGILKEEKLKNVVIDDFRANFTVEDGNLLLKPFSTKVAGQETTVVGSLSATNLLDFRLDFKVQRDAFGPDIQNILKVIPGNQKISLVPAGVIIKGPVNNPEVKMDLTDARKTITDATKDDLKNSLDKIGKGIQNLFKK